MMLRLPFPVARTTARCRHAPALWLAVALALSGSIAAGGNASAQTPGAESATPQFVVNCYDQERDLVTRGLTSDCHGRVVSDAEAQAIQEHREERLQRAFQRHPQPAPEGTRLVSIGTSFFVSEDGKLLTNNHVVDGCKAVTIETPNDLSMPVKVLAVDVHYDLALLQAAIKPPGIAVFRAQLLSNVGAPVATIGYPDQGMPPREPMVTTGTLLKPINDGMGAARIAIQADVRHGNSGGPLLDDRGQVIGVVNAKINTVTVYRTTGKVIDDLGFGIALPVVLDFLKRNNTAVLLAPEGARLTGPQLLDLARPYIARAGCWK
ncbi:MAG TPA: serine protease [Candidatus Sulfotelmatobacter sp.]|nr:serine protease [Candidatus Sulfotelmatobacter sp.]